MKVFKYLAISIVIVAAFVFITGIFVPRNIKVERKVTIKTTQAFALGHVKSLRSMDDWFPWRELDPEMKVEFKGQDGTVGSKYLWNGNEDVGKGFYEITAINESRVDGVFTFIEPWESKALTSIQLKKLNDDVEVSWSFTNETPYPFNAFNLFYDMDNLIGKDFSRGLEKLKTKIEQSQMQSMNQNEMM
jgi:hypothetical protein